MGGGHTHRPELGWVTQKAIFIDACSGPADLVSLLVGEGGPAKAVQTVDSA